MTLAMSVRETLVRDGQDSRALAIEPTHISRPESLVSGQDYPLCLVLLCSDRMQL